MNDLLAPELNAENGAGQWGTLRGTLQTGLQPHDCEDNGSNLKTAEENFNSPGIILAAKGWYQIKGIVEKSAESKKLSHTIGCQAWISMYHVYKLDFLNIQTCSLYTFVKKIHL